MPGVGKIALSAMIPILSAKGISVTTLPTALVSNTLDYGLFEILDTTDYMNKTIDIWNQLGFKFDCICTGFMVNPKQIEIVKRLISYQNYDKLMVIVDPIMGDEGKLYNGMSDKNVEIMRQLASLATVLLPNFTEATFLVNKFKEKENINDEEAKQLLNECCKLGTKSVVITSAKVNDEHCVIGYDHKNDKVFKIKFEYIDVRFPGTGDIFSGVLVSDIMNGIDLENATKHAMEVVKELIQENKDSKERYIGVNIEKFIQEGKL